MDSLETQELVRELITDADHLSRIAHAANDHTRSGQFAALRSTLQRLERRLGGEPPRFALAGELDVVYQRIRDLASRGSEHRSEEDREDLEHLLAQARRLRPAPRSVLSPPPPPPEPMVDLETEGTRWRSVVLGFAGLAALVVPLLVPALRRSRAGWGTAAGLALASAAGIVALESGPTRARIAASLGAGD